MGRKRRKRQEIDWDHEGREVVGDDQWRSRSTKRGQKRNEIMAHREALDYCSQLDSEVFEQLELDEVLYSNLKKLRDMKSSGARQRLLKHITNSTTDDEWDSLEEAVKFAKEAPERAQKRDQKLIAWRDRLVREGEDALLPAMTRFPNADLRELRQLTMRARGQKQSPATQGAARGLLKLLRTLDTLLND